jgi:uncharacterized protein (TIGR03000 family)
MYSIVMVAAMTAAPEAPDFCCKSKSYSSCYGCYGGCSGCYGCGGCTGWSYGCGGCYGCYGGCHGCHGAVTVYSSCYGCGGCYGCYGGHAYTGCGGCYGTYHAPYYTNVYIAPYYPSTGTVVPDSTPAPPPAKDAKDPKKISATDVPVAYNGLPLNRGQVLVYAPANAKLYADGHATTLTGAERTFQTPDLSEGKDFQYTLKIEYAEGTETKTQTKQVVVRGGHRTVVDFNAADDKVSSSITVSLPAKAKLFVDGSATPASGGKHTFRTPELTKGKPYVYQFRAEVERDGKTEVETKEVNFVGGEAVVVDFKDMTAVRTASAK